MKKTICQMLFLLVVAHAVPAGAGPDAYYFRLAMSQDKKLCPAITEVLSKEYNHMGIDAPPDHEWFIRWEPIGTLGEQFRNEPQFATRSCSVLSWAQFDIDDDGHVETVVKWSGCLGGNLSDTLYIFRGEEAKENIYETLMNPFAPSDSEQGKINRERLLGKISYTGELYELKKLPPFKNKKRYGREELHAIGGKVLIHPFRFDGHTYLNLYGLSGMHVIARYRSGEMKSTQLDDVCYVERRKH